MSPTLKSVLFWLVVIVGALVVWKLQT